MQPRTAITLFYVLLANVISAQSSLYGQGMATKSLWPMMESVHKKNKATDSYTYKEFIYLANGECTELNEPVIAALQAELPSGRTVTVIKDGTTVEGVRAANPTAHVFFFEVRKNVMIEKQTGTGAATGPVTADYDGDGRSDIAIYRPTLGQWWIQRSSMGLTAFQFGTNGDRTVSGDYTGDGKADVAVWRQNDGSWSIMRSEDGSFYSFPFGAMGDFPASGDYDGDGRFDAAVFRPSTSTWFVQRSTAGTLIQQFGVSGDLPVANAYVR